VVEGGGLETPPEAILKHKNDIAMQSGAYGCPAFSFVSLYLI